MLWQPFAGGARFVMLQAAAWTLYGTAIALAAFGGAATGTAGDSAAAGASVSDTAVGIRAAHHDVTASRLLDKLAAPAPNGKQMFHSQWDWAADICDW